MDIDENLYNLFIILFFVVVFLLLIYAVFNYMKFPFTIKESLESNDYIILMGDSILNNNNYVNKGNSVDSQLSNKHNNVIMVAEDNAIIDDLEYQLKKIPSNANNNSTKTIISIGGNDLLNNYLLGDVNNMDSLNKIFNKYSSSINNLKNNNKFEIILCNLYYPYSKNYVKYYDLIEIWNNKLNDFADNNNLRIITLDELVDSKKYFINEIEPSKSGSKIISDNILTL